MTLGKVKDIIKQKSDAEKENAKDIKIDNRIEQLSKTILGKLDNNEETSRVQKMLILDYLGVLKIIENDTRKMAKLLSCLIERDSDNIRKVLERINTEKLEKPKFRTERNLKEVINILEISGYKNARDKAQKDLDEVLKKKK